MDNTSAIILSSALGIIMLGMGLSLVIEDFKRVFYQPKAIFIGLINQLILLPLIAFGLAHAFDLKPEIAVGLMILAACPGGATSNLISHLAKADTALSVSLTAFSSFITIITIPFITNFALEEFMNDGNVIQMDIAQALTSIFFIVILPITLGMLIRKYKKKFALKMGKPVRIASAVLLFLIIIGIVIKEKDNMGSYIQQAGWVVLALNLIVMFLGYFSAKGLNITTPRALSIAIESGIQNGTLGITVASVLLGRTDLAIVSAVYGVLMFFTGGFAIVVGTYKSKNS
jgi:BASS family bile acid:Na+ symporter